MFGVTVCLTESHSFCHGCDRDWFACDVTNDKKASRDSTCFLFSIRGSLIQVDTRSHMLITTRYWQLYTPV